MTKTMTVMLLAMLSGAALAQPAPVVEEPPLPPAEVIEVQPTDSGTEPGTLVVPQRGELTGDVAAEVLGAFLAAGVTP